MLTEFFVVWCTSPIQLLTRWLCLMGVGDATLIAYLQAFTFARVGNEIARSVCWMNVRRDAAWVAYLQAFSFAWLETCLHGLFIASVNVEMRLWLPTFRRFNLIELETRLRSLCAEREAILVAYFHVF